MKQYKFMLIVILVLYAGETFAQQKQLASSQEEVSVSIQYLFPEFTSGYVFYKNGTNVEGKLNYNMLLEEMMFIEPVSNEQLAMDNVREVNMVSIGGRRFYPYDAQKFTEELNAAGSVRLRVLRKGSLARHSREAGYGSSSAASAIDSYSSISGTANTNATLAVKGEVLVTVSESYYLVMANGKYNAVKNQKTFTKLFPRFRSEIENYIKEKSVDFNNGSDLVLLVNYCNQLSQ